MPDVTRGRRRLFQDRQVPRRILIAGDPAVGRGMMKLVLDRLGYVVTCVPTGRDALTAAAHTRFALIVLALRLPDVQGMVLARVLRGGLCGGVPVLMFGDAWDGQAVVRDCAAAGIEGYLPKPISIGRLVEAVRDLTRRRGDASGATAMSETTAPIDTGHLDSFTEGDTGLEGELAELYLATARGYLARMRKQLDDPLAWSDAAHALKGASANIGAVSLAALARAAEHGAPCPATVDGMDTALDEVARFFRERIRARPQPDALAISA